MFCAKTDGSAKESRDDMIFIYGRGDRLLPRRLTPNLMSKESSLATNQAPHDRFPQRLIYLTKDALPPVCRRCADNI